MENEEKKNPLKIKPLESSATSHKSPPLMEAIELKHPFSILIAGATGSGKSCLLLNLLMNPNMFFQYFDKIYLIGATARSDDSFEHLGLRDERIITDDFIEQLKEITDEQRLIVEKKGIKESPKMLIIFEDCTANKKLQNSKEFNITITANRHMNTSIIMCVHKLNAMARTARLNSNHLMVFPCTNSEKEILAEEHMTHFYNKKSFMKLIDKAFETSEDDPKPFLWVNTKSKDIKQRFRKNLDTYLY